MSAALLHGNTPGRIFAVLSGVFFLLAVPSFAQFRFDRVCLDAYHEVLSLNFDRATEKISEERKSDPGNLVPVYLEDYIDFLKVFTSQERGEFEKYRKDHERRLGIVKKGDPASPFYRHCLGTMRLQWAVTRMQFGEERSAVLDLSKAYNDYCDNLERYPAFLPGNTGMGFLHVLAGLAEDSYGWLLDLAGFSGTVEQGLGEIRKVAHYEGNDELNTISRTEALFFLALANAFLSSDKSDVRDILQKLNGEPGIEKPGPLAVFAAGTICLKNGMNEEAIAILKAYKPDEGTYPFRYLDFLTGKALLNRLDPEASKYFISFLKSYRGMNYSRSAWQKLAWISLLNGDTAKYREYSARIRAEGGSLMDVDLQALQEAGSGEIPNLYLLKARLLSDGGYYDRALDILFGTKVGIMVRSKKDLVEYNYRLGRICQEKGQFDAAIRYFDETIRLGRSMPWYFAGNAALQSGLICERQKQYAAARRYFNLCISMEFGEYKTSLAQKARAGLKRIRKYTG